MTNKKKVLIALSVVVIVAGSAAVLFYLSRGGQSSNKLAELEPVLNPSLPKYGGEPIDKIGNDSFIQQVPPDYLKKYKEELTELKKILTENPNNVEKWLRVGVIKKFFNNYNGARDVWEYAKIVNPKFSTSYYNLGGLYGGYLRNNLKAEENYLKAIEIDPQLSYLYLGLAELYSVFYPEKKYLADDVILRGLKELPDNESLLQALKQYQK